jgi:GrpB-like predicted nucleotidyltransferase (UPF0157 family)
VKAEYRGEVIRLPDPIEVVPYDPDWPGLFAGMAQRIRAAMGPLALRIDHIGSTAIPGLAAKPIIDVQVSVQSFEDAAAIERAIGSLGFLRRADNPDKTQLFFREPSGDRHAHIHVRLSGSFQEAFTLLFRDYLRCHTDQAKAYEENKYKLNSANTAGKLSDINGKEPLVWNIIIKANKWSEETGWHPGKSDA